MKKIRKAIRTFLIKDNKVIAIRYKTEKNYNYYDIPGGKIEENETSEDASIREFKEETGMIINNQKYKGNVIIEYPHMIFDFDIYVVEGYEEEPIETDENYSMWIDIEELKNKKEVFPSIEILNYLGKNSINLKIISDEKHNILNIENM